MNKGVEMYKRDRHYYSKIDTGHLYKELDTYYSAETDLVRNLMSYAISDGLVETRHELGVANEELWCLNDWPEDHGFGSSDRSEYLRRIKETIAFERKFLQAENELVQINKLTECPKNDTVRKYMTMNDKIAEGMVA
tara:strand:- start:187 stop:597 length:411 start_codon:yes stop_codon:yes gene_type:complete